MGSLAEKYRYLKEKYDGASPETLLHGFITDEFPQKIALVSSFGIEAALLLDMVAKTELKTPVIFWTHKNCFLKRLNTETN